jgi:ElaB/YqjD/DUF883 family membrane-anchored ribosome-binding protein
LRSVFVVFTPRRQEPNMSTHVDFANDTPIEWPEKEENALERAQRKMKDLQQKTTAFIRENPSVALLGAITAGYLVGKLASRRYTS